MANCELRHQNPRYIMLSSHAEVTCPIQPTNMAETDGKAQAKARKTLSDSEKKRRKTSRNQTMKRVDIKDQYSRWNESRGDLPHEDFAKLLLDSYDKTKAGVPESVPGPSRDPIQQPPLPDPVPGHSRDLPIQPPIVPEPMPGPYPVPHLFTVGWPSPLPSSKPVLSTPAGPDIVKLDPPSDISSIGHMDDDRMSGVDSLIGQDYRQSGDVEYRSDDSIDEESCDEESSDETLCSSDSEWDFNGMNISLSTCLGDDSDTEELGEVSIAEFILGATDTEGSDEDPNWQPAEESEADGSLWQPTTSERKRSPLTNETVNTPTQLTASRFCVADVNCLLLLAKTSVEKCCVKGCLKPIKLDTKLPGSALVISWVCSDGHTVLKWSSQNKIRGIHSADFLMSAGCLLSGNNFAKLALWAKFSHVGMVSSATHHRIQSHYSVPAIESYWLSLQQEVLEKKRGHALILGGDGRNDSPGHCAQYCTYTLMDLEHEDILALVVKDKRQVGLKSTNMECQALKDGLQFLIRENLNLAEVATDAHSQIAKMLRDQYAGVRHSWDVWHGAKNLGKKLNQHALQKNKHSLKPWVKELIRQFWWISEHCEGSADKFMNLLKGAIHHCLNEHVWATGACQHGELEKPDKEWIVPDSPAHKALQEVFFKKRFLNTIPRYLAFRHTGKIESFNQLILMYASKRFAYDYPMYKARNQLAAIDYQKHKGREQKNKKDGQLSYKRLFNKRSNSWVRVKEMEAKTYDYIDDLLRDIARLRLADKGSQARQKQLAPDDPRRLSKTIAPVPPPSVAVLVQKHKSRFGEPD